MRRFTASVAFVIAGALVLHAADPYHLIKEITIGGEGGWDYITVDPAVHRLYVSHASKVLVADIDSGKVVGEIPNTDGVHGFAVAPELGRGFSSNGRANTSTIVNLKTLKPLGTVATGGNPDAILYEPMQKEIYTMNGNGNSATVFDAQTGKVVATIPLGGKHPAFPCESRSASSIDSFSSIPRGGARARASAFRLRGGLPRRTRERWCSKAAARTAAPSRSGCLARRILPPPALFASP